MTSFHSDKTIKSTRKVYTCEQCGRSIPAGSEAAYSAGVWYGDFYCQHQHIECRAAGLAYAKKTDRWGEDFPWFQHEREDLDRADVNWLLREHPIVAQRLGLEVDDE